MAIYLGYGLVIIAGLINVRGLTNPEGSFDLKRWHKPVSIAALMWLVVAIVALTLPAPGHNAAYGAFVGVGARRRSGISCRSGGSLSMPMAARPAEGTAVADGPG